MFSKFPWLKNRKYLLISIILDFIIFLNFFFIWSDFNIKISITFIFLIQFWIISGYVFGRYSVALINNKLFSIKRLISTISTYVLTIFFYFLIDWITNSHISDVKYKASLILYSIIFLFISYFSQISINFYINKFKKDKEKWVILTKKNDLVGIKANIDLMNLNCELKYIDYQASLNHNFNSYKGIVLTHPEEAPKVLISKIIRLKNEGKIVLNLINFCEKFIERIPVEVINDVDILNQDFYIPKDSISVRLKRLADISLSTLLIITTSPIIIISSIIIKLEDNGPIFYSQKRSGLLGSDFKMWKLRTMIVNAEPKGVRWSEEKDLRITKIGRILRKSRIDELPQLISVIKGDMSLIGPRPERPEFDKILNEEIAHYNLRYWIRPGLSGWAQTKFPYTSSINDTKIKLSYDLYYLRNFSFWLDFFILIKTIRLVSSAKGSVPKKKRVNK